MIEDLDKAFPKYRGGGTGVLTTLAQNLKFLKPERERSIQKIKEQEIERFK